MPKVKSILDINSDNILYNIIHTASWAAPSQNKISNNLGSVSSWIKVRETIVSITEINEAKK